MPNPNHQANTFNGSNTGKAFDSAAPAGISEPKLPVRREEGRRKELRERDGMLGGEEMEWKGFGGLAGNWTGRPTNWALTGMGSN